MKTLRQEFRYAFGPSAFGEIAGDEAIVAKWGNIVRMEDGAYDFWLIRPDGRPLTGKRFVSGDPRSRRHGYGGRSQRWRGTWRAQRSRQGFDADTDDGTMPERRSNGAAGCGERDVDRIQPSDWWRFPAHVPARSGKCTASESRASGGV